VKVGGSSNSRRKLLNHLEHFKVEDGLVHELLELENGIIGKLSLTPCVYNFEDINNLTNIAMTGIKDSYIRIFDFISGKLKKELKGHKDYVMEMRSIKEKRLLLSYSCDKTIKLWSTKNNFMLVCSIKRPGIVNKIFSLTPKLCLIQESQRTSFFRPNNITQILSLESRSVLQSYDKSKDLGACLGVLRDPTVLMFSKNGDSGIRFYTLEQREFNLISEYKPKYNIRDCYQLDESKVSH
jgi:hypothetical protein